MSRKMIALVAALALTVSGCVPFYDATTSANIQRLTSKEVASASCEKALAYERSKIGKSVDPKSVRHLEELCDCYARAINQIQADACRANLPAYVQYEEAKR